MNVERDILDAKRGAGRGGFLAAAPRKRRSALFMVAGITVGQADQFDGVAQAGVAGRGATGGKIGIIGMGADNQYA
jgi:hypothetical protein